MVVNNEEDEDLRAKARGLVVRKAMLLLRRGDENRANEVVVVGSRSAKHAASSVGRITRYRWRDRQ